MASTNSNFRPQPVTQQILRLAKTQQFYWFLGHVFAIIFFCFYQVLLIFSATKSLKYYKFTLLSILVTYVIVIKQIYLRKGSLANIGIAKLIRDENVQYFALASVLYLASFKLGAITGAIYSFVIFALFHVLTYFQNNLLSIVVRNLRTQQYINSAINQFTLNFNQQALVIAANSEVILLIMSVFLLPTSVIYNLLFRRDIVYVLVKVGVSAAILVFVKFRFDSNQYTKMVVQQFDSKATEFLVKLNNPSVSSLYNVTFKANLLKYASMIKAPQEPKASIKKR